MTLPLPPSLAGEFPLNAAAFMDQLPIKSVMMRCPETSEMSRTAGGEIITASIGTRLWQGTVELGRMTRRENRQVRSLLDVAQTAGASFMMHDTTAPGPLAQADHPDLAAYTVVIRALSPTDARLIQLGGLPAGYVLTRGDFLAFEYRSDPTRFALHTVAETSVTANGTGDTETLQVTPKLRPGAEINAVVTLLKASCKAVIVPGSVQVGRASRFMTEGASFNFIQTLR
jgi:hypothetical protein